MAENGEIHERCSKIPKLSEEAPLSLAFFKVKKLSSNAILPSRASSLSAGYDLSSAAEVKVPARGKALIPTDLSIAIPPNTYALIDSRSGLVLKHLIDVGEGVINADYRGSVDVILNNKSDLDFFVKPGDRIAQLIIHKIITPDAGLTESLDSTIRGTSGFGSTGLQNFHLNGAIHLQNPKRANPSSFISLPVQNNMAENGEVHEQALPVQSSMAGEIHKSCSKISILSEEAHLSVGFFKVKKLSSNAIMPCRGSSLSAGYDLSSAAEVKVPARGNALIPTDLSIAIPPNTYARIAPRSGLARKRSIGVAESVINADYRGPIGVILKNNSDLDFFVKPGDRIAQLIIHEIITPDTVQTKDLDSTIRGGGEIHRPCSKVAKLSEEAPLSLNFFKVKKLSANAILPSRASSLSAGYDLSSAAEVKVPARGTALIPIDLSIAIPQNTYARIAPRIELSWKHSIEVGAGVIDADYRGAVGIVLFNLSYLDFMVNPGDLIAQLIIEKIITPYALETEDLD